MIRKKIDASRKVDRQLCTGIYWPQVAATSYPGKGAQTDTSLAHDTAKGIACDTRLEPR